MLLTELALLGRFGLTGGRRKRFIVSPVCDERAAAKLLVQARRVGHDRIGEWPFSEFEFQWTPALAGVESPPGKALSAVELDT